ncbi:MAG: mucoidy inhibitor MuiA family protein, partial [Alphaproteobacteria bacterium]
GAIQSKNVEVPVEAAESDKATFEDIDRLEAEARKLLAEKQSYEVQKSFFENVSNKAMREEEGKDDKDKNSAPAEVAPEKWLKASRVYRDGMTEILGALAGVDARLDQLAREIARKENTLRRMYAGKNRMNVVLVPVESDAEGKLTLKISYQASNATWSPSYDARLSTEKGTVEIVQYASVSQGTGEDWKDVSLTLSTAQPQREMTMKEMKPFWIDVMEPPPQGPTLALPATPNAPQGDPLAEWRAKTEAKRVKMEQEQQPEEREVEQPEVVPMVTPIHPQPRFGEAKQVYIRTADIETGGFTSEYKIPGSTAVTADGNATKVLIGTFNAESKLQVQIRPQQATTAQLMIHTKLKGDSPILPGQVNMFRDGAYSGQSRFPLLLPDAEHDISLGIDDQITVKRRKLRDERQEQGVITKESLIAREFVTEILNLHDTPVEIIVKETTPSPKDEKITVDLRSDFTTQGYKKDDDNVKGLLSWQFVMQPREKKSLNLGWTVNWPKDYRLIGM